MKDSIKMCKHLWPCLLWAFRKFALCCFVSASRLAREHSFRCPRSRWCQYPSEGTHSTPLLIYSLITADPQRIDIWLQRPLSPGLYVVTSISKCERGDASTRKGIFHVLLCMHFCLYRCFRQCKSV